MDVFGYILNFFIELEFGVIRGGFVVRDYVYHYEKWISDPTVFLQN